MISGVDVRSIGYEQFGNIFVPLKCRFMQRGKFGPVFLCIYIQTFGYEQFNNLLVTHEGCAVQNGSPSIGLGIFERNNLRVHIRTFGDKQFNYFHLAL